MRDFSKRTFRRVLTRYGLAPGEFAILQIVARSIYVPKDQIPHVACAEAVGYAEIGNRGPYLFWSRDLTKEECETGLKSCQDKGLVQVVTATVLNKIVKALKYGEITLVAELPPLQVLDFTRYGASLWLELEQNLSPHYHKSYCITIDEQDPSGKTRYDTYWASCVRVEQSVSIKRIGAWCLPWWRIFPYGYVTSVLAEE